MSDDQATILESLPLRLAERVRTLNQRPVNRKAGVVLYWMHHAVRGHENPALDTAITVAGQLDIPILVYQGLGGRHAFNSDRHHTFIMEGARDVQQELAARGISYCFHLAKDGNRPTPLRALMSKAALVLTEDFPVPPFTHWSRRLAASNENAFWVVDTSCLLPMKSVGKFYTRAYQFRKDTWGEFEKRMSRRYEELSTQVENYHGPLGFDSIDLASANIAALCASCRIDHTVGPVPHTPGGSLAGYERWKLFKRHGLPDYARKRNDPAISFPSGVSRISAYLHHGHVSPFRIARETASSGGPNAAKFLDELLIWRELSHNFCFHHRHPDTIDALPDWAIKTLHQHRRDPRPAKYSRERLIRAKTGDPLWDAAQKSLLIHGELHNNLRMTWGKAILKWTGSPESALQAMIALNHRYALDGNDPNSYGGILWCLGLFDRPFKPERPIIGTLRPRSTETHAARLDLSAYAARVTRPATSPPLRVAVIGAGLSGLIAACTLTDHGHRVEVFEKSPKAGGRMSTRQMGSYAFDYGAQYFTVRDERFKTVVDNWLQTGIVNRWDGRIRVVDNGEIRTEKNNHQRLVGVPDMLSIARHLSASLDIRWRTRVQQVTREDQAISLTDDHGEWLGEFDTLIVATPPEQCTEILGDVSPLIDKLDSVRMDPCWAIMLAFSKPLDLPFDGAFIDDPTIVWAARNSSKPGRGTAECWVLHADPAWSTDHFDLDPEEVIQRLAASLFRVTGRMVSEPVFTAAHRWQYARAQSPIRNGCLWDRPTMIGVCGDWCNNSRIEGAYLSGAAVAGRVLSAAGNRKRTIDS